MMDAADAIIANLTPFRGPGADPGTVYELGYMAAAANFASAIATIRRPTAERVVAFHERDNGPRKALDRR
jgi:nucleoside 2-deoxyribosyltransferase